jgi:hypothetical protein
MAAIDGSKKKIYECVTPSPGDFIGVESNSFDQAIVGLAQTNPTRENMQIDIKVQPCTEGMGYDQDRNLSTVAFKCQSWSTPAPSVATPCNHERL